VSCAAVQDGLLTGLITRQRAATTQPATATPEPRSAKARAGKTEAVQAVERRTWCAQLGDDLAPVGGFLAGKLLVHTLLGALWVRWVARCSSRSVRVPGCRSVQVF
jgi:hypothetical protein